MKLFFLTKPRIKKTGLFTKIHQLEYKELPAKKHLNKYEGS